MAEDIKARLKKMNEKYKSQKDLGSEFPDGIYTFRLEKGECKVSSNDKEMIVLTFLCLEGDKEGIPLDQFFVLGSDFGWKNLCRMVRQLGYQPPEEPEAWIDFLEELVSEKICFNGQVANSKGFTNLYIKEVVQVEESTEPSEEEANEDTKPAKPSKITKGGGVDETRIKLIAFAQAQGYEVSEDTQKEDIISTFKEVEWEQEKLDASEVALLESVGLTVKKAKTTKKTLKKKG